MRTTLIERRRACYLTQEQLATRIEIPTEIYMKVESGEIDILYADWLMIAHVLHLPGGCVEELRNGGENISLRLS